MDIFNNSFNVRRSETICCLIGFGIGVSCCIIYRLISNFLTSSTNTKTSSKVSQHNIISSNDTNTKKEYLKNLKHEYDDDIRTDNISDEMTWSEISSSLSTINLLHDSYHSSSLTGDSGVDCPEMPSRNHQYYDDEHETLLKSNSHHDDTQTATECHVMSCISTEKGLERALEQTSRFYNDLEHIASDLETLTKRYSQSQTSLTHRSIDALDWDWHDDIQSPKILLRKQQQQQQQLQSNRSNNKNKIRRRLHSCIHQTEYHESDHDNRLFDYSTSPLRRKHSSVYFDSTDNTSDEDNLGDETLQINS